MPTDLELGIDPNTPRSLRPFTRWLGRTVLRVTGFEPRGLRPTERKYVLIAAPHTSNWDLVYMLAMAFTFDVRISWLGKHTLFEGPLGPLLRFLGGISIDRRSRQNMVQQAAAKFSETDDLIIAVPPEGTRKHVDHWKSGFYYIALEAGVPIVPSVLDFKTRTGTFHPAFHPSGDVEADMAKLAEIYDPAEGKFPERKGQARLRSRADEAAA